MGPIISTTTIANTDAKEFQVNLGTAIEIMQKNDLEVEIQYKPCIIDVNTIIQCAIIIGRLKR